MYPISNIKVQQNHNYFCNLTFVTFLGHYPIGNLLNFIRIPLFFFHLAEAEVEGEGWGVSQLDKWICCILTNLTRDNFK